MPIGDNKLSPRLQTLTPALTCVLVLGLMGTASAQYQVELTFDDAATPSLNNMETDTPATAALGGSAVRSALDAGRYGRAADLVDGEGAIVISRWTPADRLVAHLWVAARNRSSGVLIGHAGRWRLHLSNGELMVSLVLEDGAHPALAPTLPWPDDADFHHVTVVATGLDDTPTFTVTLDFEHTVTVTAPSALAAAAPALRLGDGLDGLIDEVVIANNTTATLSAEQDRFNRDPEYCPPGTICAEEVFYMVPRTFTHEVPVRFKSVYDPQICTPERPCPVLVAIQGGSACANDYAMPSDILPMLEFGFAVVTVDPYCEGNGHTYVPDTEVSQFIAVKDHIFSDAFITPLITGPDYYATGCSHGAEAVIIWAMREADHPLRTYARSGGVSGFCALAAGMVCGAEPFSRDAENDAVRTRQQDTDAVGMISPETVSTREMARSWGKNLEGPICGTPEARGCMEEGTWAMTYGSRRFADVWEATEDPDQPTGYMVEDVGADCRHCAPPGSEAFRCGMCLLAHSRVGMEAACPECLSYVDPTIQRGQPGALCPVEASWYQDPLSSDPDVPDVGAVGAGIDDAGIDDAGPDATTDDGLAPDANGAAPTDSQTAEDGCGCRVGGSERSAPLAILMLLGGLVIRRRLRTT